MDPSHIPYRIASHHLLTLLHERNAPTPIIGIICGSGLSGLSDTMTNTLTVPYNTIPGFPSHCGVAGHRGEMVFGELSGIPTLCFRGRFHSYEGHTMQTVVLPIRILRCFNVKICILTNAAGGLNPSYTVGDIVSISDHIAFPLMGGKNPLIGPNDEELGTRFPPMSNAYDVTLRELVLESAERLGYEFVKGDGTYCFVSGPNYESKGECRFLRELGGDAVGMSTIPEVAAAHHANLKILCLSLITNKVIISGDEGPAASHTEVLEAVQKRSIQMQSLVREFVKSSKKYIESLEDLPPVTLDVEEERRNANVLGVPLHCIGMSVPIVILGVLLGSVLFQRRK